VAARAAERERTETPEGLRAAEERAAAQDEVRAARAAQVDQLAAEARRDFERYRARAAAKRERLDAARAGERRAWLEQFLERNDVSGRAERGGLGGLTDGTRSISWVQPHNLEAKLSNLAIVRRQDPVDEWNAAARAIQEDEEKEKAAERLGGISPSGARGRRPQPAGIAAAAEGGGTAAEGGASDEGAYLSSRLAAVAEAMKVVSRLEGRAEVAPPPPPAAAADVFSQLDKDGDGAVSREEWEAAENKSTGGGDGGAGMGGGDGGAAGK